MRVMNHHSGRRGRGGGSHGYGRGGHSNNNNNNNNHSNGMPPPKNIPGGIGNINGLSGLGGVTDSQTGLNSIIHSNALLQQRLGGGGNQNLNNIPGGIIEQEGKGPLTSNMPFYVKKPSDRTIPKNISLLIPEAKLYNDLREAERSLDATINRKKLDLQDALNGTMQKPNILRLYISNTATHQSWQVTKEDLLDVSKELTPSFTLNIEGKLLGDNKNNYENLKLSSFFQKIVIELDMPNDNSTGGNLIEWSSKSQSVQNNENNNDNNNNNNNSNNSNSNSNNKNNNNNNNNTSNNNNNPTSFDKISVTRKYDKNVNARIILQTNEYPESYRLSPAITQILTLTEATKPTVVMAIWHYIKYYKLQDPDDKRVINCDDALKLVFGHEKIAFSQVIELLNPHLSPLEPTVLSYTIRVDQPYTHADNYYDIKIGLDDPIKTEMSKILSNWYNNANQLSTIDEQIASGIQELSNGRSRRDFFTQYASNPAKFLQRWNASQAREMDLILGDNDLHEEQIRRSTFYKDSLINESVSLLLNN